MRKQITALLLVFATVFAAFALAACSKPDEGTNEGGGESVEITGITEPMSEGIPENFNYGKDFTFLTMKNVSSDEWSTRDIYVESESEDPIQTAVFRRNQWLAANYGINVKEIKITDMVNEAQTLIMAGSQEFQALMLDAGTTSYLMTSGLLLDLAGPDSFIDYSKPWWDKELVDGCSVNNKVFMLSGDIEIMDDDATWVLMFNKDMIGKYGLESPYDLVKNNQWTYDKMYEMMRVVAGDGKGDTNSNGKPDHDTDVFGWTTHNSSRYALFYATGERLMTKDENDAVILNKGAVDTIQRALEKSILLWDDRSLTFSADRVALGSNETQEVFESGRALFLGEVLQLAERLRGMSVDFGLIPYPKLDASQQKYGNFVHQQGAVLSVPKSVKDLEEVTIVLEIMAYASSWTLTPAYYDTTLEGKFLRDEDSKPMLDIILSSKIYDLGYLNNFGDIGDIFPTLLAEGSTNFSSKFASKINPAESKIRTFMKKMATAG